MRISQGWLQGIRHCRSPNFNQRPPNDSIDLLVIHNISLPPGVFGGDFVCDFFQNTLDISAHPYFANIASLKVSAHCLIKRSGELVQFVNFDDRAWHAGKSRFRGKVDCNNYSIGIEVEGADDIPYSSHQYDILARLTRVLQSHYPDITDDRIVGHSDVAPNRKTDPGLAFDWSRYRDLLAVTHAQISP